MTVMECPRKGPKVNDETLRLRLHRAAGGLFGNELRPTDARVCQQCACPLGLPHAVFAVLRQKKRKKVKGFPRPPGTPERRPDRPVGRRGETTSARPSEH
jgi:hypothetical protein